MCQSFQLGLSSFSRWLVGDINLPSVILIDRDDCDQCIKISERRARIVYDLMLEGLAVGRGHAETSEPD
jgi:hypothetical protein